MFAYNSSSSLASSSDSEAGDYYPAIQKRTRRIINHTWNVLKAHRRKRLGRPVAGLCVRTFIRDHENTMPLGFPHLTQTCTDNLENIQDEDLYHVHYELTKDYIKFANKKVEHDYMAFLYTCTEHGVYYNVFNIFRLFSMCCLLIDIIFQTINQPEHFHFEIATDAVIIAFFILSYFYKLRLWAVIVIFPILSFVTLFIIHKYAVIIVVNFPFLFLFLPRWTFPNFMLISGYCFALNLLALLLFHKFHDIGPVLFGHNSDHNTIFLYENILVIPIISIFLCSVFKFLFNLTRRQFFMSLSVLRNIRKRFRNHLANNYPDLLIELIFTNLTNDDDHDDDDDGLKNNHKSIIQLLNSKFWSNYSIGQSLFKSWDQVSIIFCELRNFQDLLDNANLQATHLITLLDRFFFVIDKICRRRKVQKIETVGEIFVGVGSVHADIWPSSKSKVKRTGSLDKLQYADAHATVLCGLDIVSKTQKTSPDHVTLTGYLSLVVAIGVASGPIMSGVVGKLKPQYALFGDTINTASRMQSSAKASSVHITSNTYNLLKYSRDLVFKRSDMEVKGKGVMTTYYVKYSNIHENSIYQLSQNIQRNRMPDTVSALEINSGGMLETDETWSQQQAEILSPIRDDLKNYHVDRLRKGLKDPRTSSLGSNGLTFSGYDPVSSDFFGEGLFSSMLTELKKATNSFSTRYLEPLLLEEFKKTFSHIGDVSGIIRLPKQFYESVFPSLIGLLVFLCHFIIVTIQFIFGIEVDIIFYASLSNILLCVLFSSLIYFNKFRRILHYSLPIYFCQVLLLLTTYSIRVLQEPLLFFHILSSQFLLQTSFVISTLFSSTWLPCSLPASICIAIYNVLQMSLLLIFSWDIINSWLYNIIISIAFNFLLVGVVYFHSHCLTRLTFIQFKLRQEEIRLMHKILYDFIPSNFISTIEGPQKKRMTSARQIAFAGNFFATPIESHIRMFAHNSLAYSFRNMAICVLDIVDFTKYCAVNIPEVIVEHLNTIFSYFDEVVSSFPNILKLHTIGDAYVFVSHPRHTESIAYCQPKKESYFLLHEKSHDDTSLVRGQDEGSSSATPDFDTNTRETSSKQESSSQTVPETFTTTDVNDVELGLSDPEFNEIRDRILSNVRPSTKITFNSSITSSRHNDSKLTGLSGEKDNLSRQEIQRIIQPMNGYDSKPGIYDVTARSGDGDSSGIHTARHSMGDVSTERCNFLRDDIICTLLVSHRMLAFMKNLKLKSNDLPTDVRLGLHLGRFLGGIIGTKVIRFDLWGKSLKTVFHVCSHADVNYIFCSDHFYHILSEYIPITESAEINQNWGDVFKHDDDNFDDMIKIGRNIRKKHYVIQTNKTIIHGLYS